MIEPYDFGGDQNPAVEELIARLRSLFKIALTEVSGIKLRGP